MIPINSPYIRAQASVPRVMLKVLVALLPGLAAYVWQFGPAILVQITLSTLTALICEAVMLGLRSKPLGLYLGDLSVVVTAWLIALSFPSIAPWWLIVTATAIAVVVAKHLYGGLGQNPFNPAMVAYAIMIVAFPSLMTQWPVAHGDIASQIHLIFGGERIVDGITSATPLDALRTGLREAGATVANIRHSPAFGMIGGNGMEWVVAGYLLGGLWLLQQRIITWHIPASFLITLTIIASCFWWADSSHFSSPLTHLAIGGSVLGGFFILTDPVSASATPRGKLIYAAGAALIVYLIRAFGNYPDGIAFATLLMNLCVPLIDMKTQPPVFGHKTRKTNTQQKV